MYLRVEENIVVNTKDIIGIFDMVIRLFQGSAETSLPNLKKTV